MGMNLFFNDIYWLLYRVSYTPMHVCGEERQRESDDEKRNKHISGIFQQSSTYFLVGIFWCTHSAFPMPGDA